VQLFDTNILIDIVKGREAAVRVFLSRPGKSAISALTVQEMVSGARAGEVVEVNRLIASFRIVEVDEPIARLSGAFLKQYRKSHRLDPNDTVLAATAEIGGYDLVTQNLKHFPMFPGLQRPY